VSEQALLISPEEAELIMSDIRGQETVQVHLLTYAAPVTRKMLHFNDLKYYATPSLPRDYRVPTWLQIEVGFFSGRLYFEWHEYEGILEFLGLRNAAAAAVKEQSPDSKAANVGDVTTASKMSHETFTAKPLLFLQDWISERRKIQDWSSSPMGFIVAGKKLHSHHPFFSSAAGGASEEGQKAVFVAEDTSKQQPEDELADDDDVFFVDAEEGAQDEEWDDRKEARRVE
jgi:hypothetical protein